MRKLPLGFIVICLLGLLMIPIASATTTYHDATIDTSGRSLTVMYQDNTYEFLSIQDTSNGIVRDYFLRNADLGLEGEVYNARTGITSYVILYSDIIEITITSTNEGFDLTFNILFGARTHDSVISITYTLNGIGMTLPCPQISLGTYKGTMQIVTVETPPSILDQIIEWFGNLF